MDWAAPEIDAEALAAADAAAEQPHDGPGFEDLGVPHRLVRALRAQGITDPFPIQRATIPDAISGRDVLGRGRTGSGKTLGFGLPLLTRLTGREHLAKAPGAVVLVPTRELAMQVADVLSPLAREVGLSVQLVAGGMAYAPQVRALERGVDVLVATPGRLIDLMNQGAADLSQVQIIVLDEADHMADLGFLPDVKTVLAAVPADGQRLLFSATLDRGVGGLVRDHLHDPVTHEVDRAEASVTTMTHHLVHVAPADKTTITAEIANRRGRSVLFVRTQRGADRVAEQLRAAGVMAGALHGGLTQGARSRILAAFKSGSVPVLVATDVAARGIHVDEVGLVLQVDPPADSKDYLHRAGRTARAGEDGAVVTLVLPHQRREMSRLVHRAGVGVEPFAAGPDNETLYRATGARKPAGEPITEESYAALIAPPPGRPRRGGRPGGRGGRGFGQRRGYGRR
ncbi:DEAD/DEAH box helicase [Enemella sp. A6]|uniref:DEAD/DEAH box helicase n=1 Tax=Enemella sp. A6 TaxID=3440152 RepID=UPI003EC0F94D